MDQEELFLKVLVANKFLPEGQAQSLLIEWERKKADEVVLDFPAWLVERGRLSQAQADAAELTAKYNRQRIEDKRRSVILIADKAISEGQVRRFLDEQQRLFKDKRKIISAIELMVQSCVLMRDRLERCFPTGRMAPIPDEEIATNVFQPVADALEELVRGAFRVRHRVERVIARTVDVVALSGDCDGSNVGILDEMLEAVIFPSQQIRLFVIIDMEELASIGVSSLGVLAGWSNHLRQSGGVLRIVRPHKKAVADTVELAGLAPLQYADLEEAVASVVD